jgi:hypothetical protein
VQQKESIVNSSRRFARPSPRACIAAGLIALFLLPVPARCQITPAQADQIRASLGDRIEALTILGGDYLLGGGHYRSTADGPNTADLDVSKFGGSGEFNDLEQLGDLNIAWRPRLMGNMGTVDFKKEYNSGMLAGDLSTTKTFAVQFGGGARFWLTDEFSLAPTIVGMYGRTTNEYTAKSAFMVANLAKATQAGLVDWTAETWTARGALNVQYLFVVDRTMITLSSEPTYLHTESFKSSNSNVDVNGNSVAWVNKADVDVPLGHMLFGHELRSGGYFERTELYGGIKDGLNTGHINEIHGRLVLDYLNELWLTQWIGLGASYYWGGNFTGYSVGIDFMLVF